MRRCGLTFWSTEAISTVSQDTIDMLNAADLVIIGRSGPSSSFQDSVDQVVWNAITAPVLLDCPWKSRSSRLKWFNSTNAYHSNESPPVAYGTVANPNDPVFTYAVLGGDSIDWCLPPHDFIGVTETTNGEIIVSYDIKGFRP